MQTIALRIGFFVLIGIGAFIARPYLMGNVGELKVGDCFDVPSVTETIEDVQHHPCTDAHEAEVFFVGKLSTADGVPYPDDDALASMVQPVCTPVFDAYTGLSVATDPVWTYGAVVPLEAGWAAGERDLMCYANRMDDKPTSASIKKS